jgi:Tfp pilus assembly protein PilN
VRPVNLIPVEDRRGDQAPLRSGPLVYILLGALVALLAGVTVLVLTSNQISERESEVVTLEAEDSRAETEATRLVAFTQFRDMSKARAETVASLADSRFDWERVMRELALILPADTWLTKLVASAAGGAESEGGGGGAVPGVSGPTLQFTGCSTGQEAVARFVTALKDIDGVTRVAVKSSELPTKSSGGGGSGGGGKEECRTRKFFPKFEIVATFDAAPVPVTEEAEVAPEAAPEAAQVAGAESEGG